MEKNIIMEKIEYIKKNLSKNINFYTKLRKLEGIDTTNHNYNPLGKILSIIEIDEFEKDNKCFLPLEYKLFLQYLGDGGLGPPGGGILKLKDTLKIPNDNEFNLPKDYFKNEFIFSKATYLLSEFPLEKLKFQDFSDEDKFIDENYYQFFQGTIIIGNNFDSYIDLLVISGSEKGNIWRTNILTFYPIKSRSGKSRVNFIDWFSDWLESSNEKLKKSIEVFFYKN